MDVKKVNTDTVKLDDLDEFREDGCGEHLTTNQGVRINDNQNSLKAGDRGSTLSKISIFARKSPTSITNAFPRE